MTSLAICSHFPPIVNFRMLLHAHVLVCWKSATNCLQYVGVSISFVLLRGGARICRISICRSPGLTNTQWCWSVNDNFYLSFPKQTWTCRINLDSAKVVFDGFTRVLIRWAITVKSGSFEGFQVARGSDVNQEFSKLLELWKFMRSKNLNVPLNLVAEYFVKPVLCVTAEASICRVSVLICSMRFMRYNNCVLLSCRHAAECSVCFLSRDSWLLLLETFLAFTCVAYTCSSTLKKSKL